MMTMMSPRRRSTESIRALVRVEVDVSGAIVVASALAMRPQSYVSFHRYPETILLDAYFQIRCHHATGSAGGAFTFIDRRISLMFHPVNDASVCASRS